jgi:hypothetical protein
VPRTPTAHRVRPARQSSPGGAASGAERAVDHQRQQLVRFDVRTATLDDVFMTLTTDHAPAYGRESEITNV